MSIIKFKITSEYYSKYGGTVNAKDRSNKRPDEVTKFCNLNCTPNVIAVKGVM
jgi:hypothetical protein